jgi:periplasmic divalent cation tolerance protein
MPIPPLEFMSPKRTNALVVLITTATRDEAVRLAEMLVGSRLAACVQLLPEIESVYRWEGEVKREAEILLLVKTTEERFIELVAQVRAMHSYETPEILALPVHTGLPAYLQWLRSNVEDLRKVDAPGSTPE